MGGYGEYTLLHHPEGNRDDLLMETRAQLMVGEPSGVFTTPPWMVQCTALTTGGSSGGMLIDNECRAIAVHVSAWKNLGSVKTAVLLSVLHALLARHSPWHGILPPLVHIRCDDHVLPPRCETFVGRADALELWQG